MIDKTARFVQEHFLSTSSLRPHLPKESQLIVDEVSRLLSAGPFEGYSLVRMGAEHLVFVLEDPKQRDFVVKINYGLAMSALGMANVREGRTDIREIQMRCRELTEQERVYQESVWKGIKEDFPNDVIPTRRSKIMDVPCSEALYRAMFASYASLKTNHVEESKIVPPTLPVLISQQRQANAAQKEVIQMGEKVRFAAAARAITDLSQELHDPSPFSELTLRNAFDEAFPPLVALVKFARADARRFADFQAAVLRLDASAQQRRIVPDILGDSNLFFVHAKAKDAWKLLFVDPIFPRHDLSLERPTFELLEKAIQENKLPFAQRSLKPRELMMARALFYEATAIKTLAWACGVPSTLTIKGVDGTFSFD